MNKISTLAKVAKEWGKPVYYSPGQALIFPGSWGSQNFQKIGT